jgi:uncharacterized protein
MMSFEIMQHLELFILLALLAEILGTIGGFGSSIFFVPIAGMFLDFHSVLGITALFHLSSNISKITLFRKGFDKKLILQIGIPSVVCVMIGAYFSKYISDNILQVILSCVLIVLSLILLSHPTLKMKPNAGNAVAGGSASGFMAGLLGTGGAIRGLTMGAFKLEKTVFIATSAVVDLGVDASRSAVYFSNGFIHTHDLYLIPLLFVVSFIGTYFGKKLLTKFSEDQFQKTVLVMVLITGLFTIAQLIWF